MFGIQDDVLISFVFRTFDLLEVGAIFQRCGYTCLLLLTGPIVQGGSVNYRLISENPHRDFSLLFSNDSSCLLLFVQFNKFHVKDCLIIIVKIKENKYFDEYICSFFKKSVYNHNFGSLFIIYLQFIYK